MILVSIFGGLGNQMFQYAAARALALRCGQPLVLDLRHYAGPREHGYALDAFRLSARVGEARELPPRLRHEPLRALASRLARRDLPRWEERAPGFAPDVMGLQGPVWLHGYFQTERYFADHAPTIRAEFTPRAAPDAANAALLAEIAATPSVSVHVRRGDYVRNPRFNALHGTCPPEYYAAAAAKLCDRHGQAHFFVFSDDPAWARDNLRLPGPMRVIDHNAAASASEDLRLMSACRHHIIANSTFSWWGAWLNPRSDKTVIAPSRWFSDPGMHNPDLLPSGWLRVAPDPAAR
ncbi:MAG: alpha-1,2-fucosyltransferase [Rhodobacteraceae bacterium]|nr:alpha-1,2-fucosyltransferase [Paracoccaceae bacterium]